MIPTLCGNIDHLEGKARVEVFDWKKGARTYEFPGDRFVGLVNHLQWHPDGTLVAMGPEHPVTGGYLQPATVVTPDLWKLGQLAPGDRVRLVGG